MRPATRSTLCRRPVDVGLVPELAGSPLGHAPLFLRNEAAVAAVGEMEFNASQRADPLIYVSLNEGLGAGVIVGDRLLTGHCGIDGKVSP